MKTIFIVVVSIILFSHPGLSQNDLGTAITVFPMETVPPFSGTPIQTAKRQKISPRVWALIVTGAFCLPGIVGCSTSPRDRNPSPAGSLRPDLTATMSENSAQPYPTFNPSSMPALSFDDTIATDLQTLENQGFNRFLGSLEHGQHFLAIGNFLYGPSETGSVLPFNDHETCSNVRSNLVSLSEYTGCVSVFTAQMGAISSNESLIVTLGLVEDQSHQDNNLWYVVISQPASEHDAHSFERHFVHSSLVSVQPVATANLPEPGLRESSSSQLAIQQIEEPAPKPLPGQLGRQCLGKKAIVGNGPATVYNLHETKITDIADRGWIEVGYQVKAASGLIDTGDGTKLTGELVEITNREGEGHNEFEQISLKHVFCE